MPAAGGRNVRASGDATPARSAVYEIQAAGPGPRRNWCFALPVPIAVAALVTAPRLLPSDTPAAGRGRIDAPGALTATGGLLLLVYAIA
ncbi:hypothetical protein ACFWDI_09425 [Streptomyces sp. NPDC060064]|uniref:hypothetical protein n=1 Tax=Streptomyces sp. NPDC060064 TaxID=3347049 RepID=UPI0036A127CF